jgi:hypothetical protein
MFKLKDINEINKRIVNFLFEFILRLKLNNKESKFFVIFTTNTKQSIDSTIESFFNHELEIKVRFKIINILRALNK